MARIIAREDYAQSKGGRSCSAYVVNRGVDYTQAIALGAGVKGSYASNQLVAREDICSCNCNAQSSCTQYSSCSHCSCDCNAQYSCTGYWTDNVCTCNCASQYACTGYYTCTRCTCDCATNCTCNSKSTGGCKCDCNVVQYYYCTSYSGYRDCNSYLSGQGGYCSGNNGNVCAVYCVSKSRCSSKCACDCNINCSCNSKGTCSGECRCNCASQCSCHGQAFGG